MRCCTIVRAPGKQVQSAPQRTVVRTAFGTGGHRSCGVLVGVFWCVMAPGSGKGEMEIHSRTHEKGNRRDSGLVSWVQYLLMVAAWGTGRLGVEAPDGKGVPSGVLGLSLQVGRAGTARLAEMKRTGFCLTRVG